MNTHAEKTQENKGQSIANEMSQRQKCSESIFQFVDSRAEAVAQRKLHEMANNSSQSMQIRIFQEMANYGPQTKQAAQLQAMADNSTQQQHPIQKKENNTGLHDLKYRIENLSGYSMDDVNVHFDSDKPSQIQAHAYAQVTDIHLGPGQEKHLPHEAGHVVQQKQGRVKPTMQMKRGVNVNGDAGREKEVDVMGVKLKTGVAPLQRVAISASAMWNLFKEKKGDEWFFWGQGGNHVGAIRPGNGTGEVTKFHVKKEFKGAKTNRIDWVANDNTYDELAPPTKLEYNNQKAVDTMRILGEETKDLLVKNKK